MVNNWNSKVSDVELDALITPIGNSSEQSMDVWAPARFWFMFAVVLSFALWLLTSPAQIASTLTLIPIEAKRLTTFLYFRGWFLVLTLLVGSYAYLKNWYTGLVLGALALISAMNILFDLFTIFPDLIANRSPFFTGIVLLRLVVLFMALSIVFNRSRLPVGSDRANLFLPFRKISKRPL